MIVRSISVNQFMKYDKPTKVEGIRAGINIVAGPNEMGKSTLLTALRAAFFERHRSQSTSIRNYQNSQNRAAPVVSVEFEIEGKVYEITKRFIKRPQARLCVSDGRVIEGDAAEIELLNLLNHGDGGRPGGSGTLGMWSVFWVEQGSSFRAIDWSEDARSGMQIALEAEVGTVLGGKRGRELPKRFENQRLQYVTARTATPRGDYKTIIESETKIRDEISALNDNRVELSSHLDNLETAEHKLSELSSEEADRADQASLKQAEDELKLLDELYDKIDNAKSEIDRNQIDIDRLQRDLDELVRLSNEIDMEKNAIESVRDQLRVLQVRKARNEDNFDRQKKELDKVKLEKDELEQQLKWERIRKTAFQLHKEISELEDRLQEYRARVDGIQEKERRQAEIFVTQDAIERIRRAAEVLAVSDAELSANSVSVELDLAPNIWQDATVNDEALQSGRHEIESVEKLVIRAAQLGTITVIPAVEKKGDLIDARESARAGLEKELREVGADSVEHAADLFIERQTLLQSIESARNDLEQYLRISGVDSNAPTPFENQVELRMAKLTSQLKLLEVDDVSELTANETAVAELEEEIEEKNENLRLVEKKYDGVRTILEDDRNEHTGLERDETHHLDQKRSLQSQLDILRVLGSESDLKEKIELAESRQSELKRTATDLERKFSQGERDILVARIERLKKALKNRDQQRNQFKLDITDLKARIESMEGVGIEEKIRLEESKLDVTVAEKFRIEREVAVLNLLLNTLGESEKAARERFLAPILDRVRPYLRTLFPEAEMTMDERFDIDNLARGQGFAESFDTLSMGTQEQIAVLTRIAFSELLVDKGYPAMIVLDDALVFSDENRMGLMLDILNAASKNVQIIILTCREKLFEGLGDAVLGLKTADPEKLQSA